MSEIFNTVMKKKVLYDEVLGLKRRKLMYFSKLDNVTEFLCNF